MDISRRNFLKASACGALCAAMAPSVLGQTANFWSLPRELWLTRPSTGEQIREVYWADGQLVWDGYARICHILRDVQSNKVVQMSPILLDILTGTQGWLRGFNINRPLVTHSGYRTPYTNANTEGAALNSRHMHGDAWDGHIEGVSSESLARFGLYLRGGGVGYYARRNFVHLDAGRLRYWAG